MSSISQVPNNGSSLLPFDRLTAKDQNRAIKSALADSFPGWRFSVRRRKRGGHTVRLLAAVPDHQGVRAVVSQVMSERHFPSFTEVVIRPRAGTLHWKATREAKAERAYPSIRRSSIVRWIKQLEARQSEVNGNGAVVR
jgi:Large polyvalent protein associated domain 29